MTEFTIILEDGSLYKNVLVKLGNVYAKTNADIYWYLKENKEIQVFANQGEFSVFINKKDIYYFTTSKQYN